jgi:DNA-binding SARP family transcriptional activator
MARLHLTLLGGFEARVDPGGPVAFARQKVEALLAFLAVRPGQLHRRDTLASLLWSDAPSARARASLRTGLAELRTALGPVPSCLVERGDGVGLDPTAVDVDVARFEALVADGGPVALVEAGTLYRGDLLEGVRVVEAPFEEWLMAERERLRELALEALARLLAGQVKAEAHARAVQTALRLVALDPLQESAHRALMRLYLRLGRRGAGLRQYQACLDVLRRELGAEPEPETRALYLELLQSATLPDNSEAAVAVEPGGEPAIHAAPFLGRADDMVRLGRAYEEARRGRTPVVMVTGEAGVGKTRLIEELVATLSPSDTRVVIGRAHETESHLPFGVWVHALRSPGVDADVRRLAQRRRARRGELARLLPELGGEVEAQAVTGDVGRLFEALAEVIRELGRSGLLLVLEDLHWADPSSLRFLAFLARRLEGLPIAVVASAREEELVGVPVLKEVLAELEREGRSARLGLSALAPDATRALVRSLARTGTDPARLDRLGDEIVRVSEGYPFMVVESMRAVAEGGTTAATAGVPLPERVRDTVAGRLERLSERGRRLTSLAAVIDREFEFRVLQLASGLDPVETASAVEELVGRRILHAVGERLDFSHDWIRRAALDRVLSPVRPALHEAVGRAIETLHADRLDEVHDRLAHHFAQAGNAGSAVRYLRRFAEAASRRYALDDAVALLREALEHAARLPAAERDGARVRISVQLATTLSVAGRFREIRELLEPLRDGVEGLDDPALAGPYFARLALTLSLLGDHAGGDSAARRAEAEAHRSGDRVTLGMARYVLAVEAFTTGHGTEGLTHARESVALLEAAGHHPWIPQAWWILGFTQYQLGEIDEAIQSQSRLASVAETLGDDGWQATALWSTALCHLARGDVEAAEDTARRSLARAPDASNRATAEALLALAAAEVGDVARATPLLEESARRLEAFRLRQAVVTVALAGAYREMGRLAEARAAAGSALELGRQASFAWARAAAERELGRIALADRDRDGSRRHLDAARELFAAIPARIELARTHLDLAQLEDGNDAAARASARRADLEAALRLFHAARAPRLVDRARQLAAALGVPLAPSSAD